MGDPQKTPEVSQQPEVALTKAGAAQAVKREVPALDKEGKPTGETKLVAVKADEVFAFAVLGKQVIVVTVDGQKLEGKL